MGDTVVRTADALLLLSFGGPERPEDVMPFLENVTRGRGVPRERLEAVAEHYLHFGGVSPINALNRDIIAAVEAELAAAGLELPVYFGNRNWHPMVEDTVARMAADGVGSALVFPTSAWGGNDGCLEYQDDHPRARAAGWAASTASISWGWAMYWRCLPSSGAPAPEAARALAMSSWYCRQPE